MARYLQGAVLAATVAAIQSQLRTLSEDDAVKAAAIALVIGQQIGRNWDETSQGVAMSDAKELAGEQVVADGWEVFVAALEDSEVPS